MNLNSFIISKKQIGIISVIYGLIFIIIDINHYLVATIEDIEFEKSEILGMHFNCEPIPTKIVNWTYCLLIIIAGINLLNRNKFTWFLYQIAFIGIILKPGLWLLVGGRTSTFYIMHFCIALLGLILTNMKNGMQYLSFQEPKRNVKQIIAITLNIMILWCVVWFYE